MKRRFSILLVEDDPTLGPVTAEALRFLGHAVSLADTVTGAYDCLEAANDFDALVLDLELGSERGETLIERLRAASLFIPEVIILSAQPPFVLARAARQTAACSAIQKPVSLEQLSAEIERCVAT
jgi:DNA-binding NtrC family response regulator